MSLEQHYDKVVYQKYMAANLAAYGNPWGPRGFLSNYPSDVVYVVNGRPVTRTDILDAKRARQRRILDNIRRNWEPISKPCFVWTFFNKGFLFGGWHLYIKTIDHSWGIGSRHHAQLILPIMRLFPCGYLPVMANFHEWMIAFANAYHYPTQKRPENQGMAIARATIDDTGRLLSIEDILS